MPSLRSFRRMAGLPDSIRRWSDAAEQVKRGQQAIAIVNELKAGPTELAQGLTPPNSEAKPMANGRNTGYYGDGTPQVVIYGPDERPFATAASPWVQRNNTAPHHDLVMPEGETWDWSVAMQLHPKMTFWAILCDYKGPEKYEPDDLSEAPAELRDLIGRCRSHYRRRAILKTARKVEVRPGEAVRV